MKFLFASVCMLMFVCIHTHAWVSPKWHVLLRFCDLPASFIWHHFCVQLEKALHSLAHLLNQQFLTRQFCTQETLGDVWRSFWLRHFDCKGSATGIWWVEAKDAAKCPTTQRQPHNTDTQPQVLVVPPSRNAAQDGHPQWKVLSEGRSHGTRTTFSSCIWDSGMQSRPSPIRSLVPACSACDGKILFSISQKHLERVQENLF